MVFESVGEGPQDQRALQAEGTEDEGYDVSELEILY